MYEDFLTVVLAYVQALNAAAKSVDEKPDLTPYVNHVPVILSGELSGFLVDEVGGQYSYRAATQADTDWWIQRPWRKISQ